MRTRTFLTLTGALLASTLVVAEPARFSQSLSTEQRTSAGIDRLNSDQVAALDALVRLNLNNAAAEARKAEQQAAKTNNQAPAPAAQPVAFTQSLSADQRRAAGLDTLTAEQTATVDTLVAAQIAPAPRYQPSVPGTVEAVEFFPNRFEVHGEFGLSIGGGSGYSSRAGWVTTSLLDTKTGTEIGVSVATGREKWRGPYRYGYTDDWRSIGFSIGAPVLGRP